MDVAGVAGFEPAIFAWTERRVGPDYTIPPCSHVNLAREEVGERYENRTRLWRVKVSRPHQKPNRSSSHVVRAVPYLSLYLNPGAG